MAETKILLLEEPLDSAKKTWRAKDARKENLMRTYEVTEEETLRGQTVHSVHCIRTPQQAKIRFDATLLVFFDLLRRFGFHKQI